MTTAPHSTLLHKSTTANDAVRCDKCLSTFQSARSFEYHQTNMSNCSLYRNVLFTCVLCSFTTRGLKNIETHMRSCISDLSLLQQGDIRGNTAQGGNMQGEHMQGENIHGEHMQGSRHVAEITYLQARLEAERLKAKILGCLLEQNTGLRVGDICVEPSPDELHLYLPTTSNPTCRTQTHQSVRAIIHTYASTTQHVTIVDDTDKITPTLPTTSSLPPSTKKHTFRSLPALSTPVVASRDIDSDVVPATTKTVVVPCSPDELVEHTSQIDQVIQSLKTAKVYVKILAEIRNRRNALWGRISPDMYKNILEDHIKAIEYIFLNTKAYAEKKIQQNTLKSLSSIECRLVGYGTFQDVQLDSDDMDRFLQGLVATTSLPDVVSLPLSENVQVAGEMLCYNAMFQSLRSYAPALFSMRELLRTFVFYRGSGIVYVPLPRNASKDPFSFYTLDHIAKGQRYWMMNCRLDELTEQLSSALLSHLITTFRQLYKHVFNDNTYRRSYENTCCLTQIDCEQLILNILVVGHKRSLCALMRQCAMEYCTHEPQPCDRFNVHGDDFILRKKYQEKDDFDVVELLKQVFDNITAEEAVDFFRSKHVDIHL